MGETASYGVKSIQGSNNPQSGKASINQSDPRESSGLEIGESIKKSQAEGENSSIRTIVTSPEISMDERRTESIRRLLFEKGRRDERLQDPEFTKTVLSKYEDICKACLTEKVGGSISLP
jgi:hypothetical protein